ncbi:MAG: hypothetical protein ACLUFN_04340 [Eubacterium sp.]
MKKAIKIICIGMSVLLMIIVIALLPIYTHNDNYIEQYQNNMDLFNKYVDSIDFQQDSGIVKVPDYLKDISISEIEINNSFIFFEIADDSAYYGGIYYSLNDNYAEETPIWGDDGIYYEEFHRVRDDMLVKGKKNNGKDWYLTEKIANNWYYYEVHI